MGAMLLITIGEQKALAPMGRSYRALVRKYQYRKRQQFYCL